MKKRNPVTVSLFAAIPMTGALILTYIAWQQAWTTFEWFRGAFQAIGDFFVTHGRHLAILFVIFCVAWGLCYVIRFVYLSILSTKECHKRGGTEYDWFIDYCIDHVPGKRHNFLWTAGQGPYR